ncbi:MAG: ParB/RepB/Spo0J family partition protein, partial [Syntrophales bacterium]|nr:ParB/RepB/Spo0J family partition protein [Syntrophales bacterium]
MAAQQAPAFEKGKLYYLPIIDIKPDPDQPRKYMDPQALEELAASIKQFGVLQPVLFRQDKGGAVIIVAGERRFAAAQSAGLTAIPGILVEGSPAEIALVENLQRQDLTVIEEAEALGRLVDNMKYTQEQAAGVIGKSRQTVTDILSLTRLPQEIRDDCRNNAKCPRQLLIEIARKKQERAMINLYNKYKESGLTTGEIHKERQTHEAKTELEIVKGAVKNLQSMKTNVAKLELAIMEEEEKTAFVSEINQ